MKDLSNNSWFYKNFRNKDKKKSIKIKEKNSMYNITNNGIYLYKEGFYKRVFYMDIHSMYPYIAYINNLFDDEHKKLYEEKIKIDIELEKLKGTKKLTTISNLKEKRENIKKTININCSKDKNLGKKDNFIRRSLIVDESTKLMSSILNNFKYTNIIHCICDGFYYVMGNEDTFESCVKKIEKVKKEFEEKFNIGFEYEVKYYDFCLIKNCNNIIAYNKEKDEIILKTDFDIENKEEIKDEIKKIIEKRGEIKMNEINRYTNLMNILDKFEEYSLENGYRSPRIN